MAALSGVPASTCFRCSRAGIVSIDQQSVGKGMLAASTLRFECVCGYSWTTDAEWAYAHGRFLDRANLR